MKGWSGLIESKQTEWREVGELQKVTLVSALRLQAANDPHRILYLAEDEQLQAARLLADAEALAVSLWELGLRSGDVVSFQLPNWTEVVVIDIAATLLGLISNPISPIYRDAEVAMMLADCQSRAIFIPKSIRGHDYLAMMKRLRPQLPALKTVIGVKSDAGSHHYADLINSGRGRSVTWPKVDHRSIKLIMYTSGTTGRAKGVIHSHQTIAAAADACLRAWNLGCGDVMIMPSPVTHITGYVCGIVMPLLFGTQTVLMEKWDAAAAIDLIDKYQVNATVGATPFLKELVDSCVASHSRLPSLKVFACGGAAVSPGLIYAANENLDCRAFRVYGLTEAPLVTSGSLEKDGLELCAETDGRVFDYEVKIVAENGKILPPGAEGEILVRGKALFHGYTDPIANQESFDRDGFFRTGDMGLRAENGTILITGRKKDLIIRGGENISAKEIEDAIDKHSAVREVAVVSIPHERMGETVCAAVIPVDETSIALEDIVEFVKIAGLAKQKYPEHIELMEDFPRTASGKVRKDLLRQMIVDRLQSDPL